MLKILYENPAAIVRAYFKDKDGNPLELADYQTEFIKEALSMKHSRMCIVAATQSGKSEALACLLSLFAIFFPNERIVNISYTEQQSRIIFERTKAHLAEDSATISEMVDVGRSLGKTKEFSKNRMFMKNGTDLRIMSTGTGETEKTGDSLLGFEATILVVDEASSIPTELFYTKILRMLGAKRTTGHDKMLILSGTPQTAGGYFEDAFNDPDYYKIKIDWRRAVKAGRMDEKTVMEQKRKMTKSQFTSWYDAEFPAMGEDSIFDMDECRRNVVEQNFDFVGKKALGVDVARYGQDSTVYTLVDRTKETFRIVDILSDDKRDLMSVAGRIVALHKTYKFDVINVDDTGIGCLVKGTEVLTEKGWKPVEKLTACDRVYSKQNNCVSIENIIGVEEKVSNIIHLNNGYSFSYGHWLPIRTRKEYDFGLYTWERATSFKYFCLDTEFNWDRPQKDFFLIGIKQKMPYGGFKEIGVKKEINGINFAKLLGWFLSEGNLDKYSIDISQSNKSRHLPFIEESINLCGLKFSKKLSKVGEYKFVIHSKELRDWLEKNCYYSKPFHSQNKKVPDWLKYNSRAVIQSFLEQYNKRDGMIHHGLREYVSNSKELSEGVLELVYKSGKYGNIRIKQKKGSETFIHGRKVIRDHDCYVVYEWKNREISVAPKITHTQVEEVYDVHITGDSRLYMVRFSDKRAFWVHNGGVTDRLKELGLPVFGVVAGAKCTTKEFEETCINLKAELYMKAKMLFEQDRLKIIDKGRLLYELRQMKKEYQSNGKMKVMDPDKSPDFCSSLIYSIFEPNTGTFVIVDFKPKEHTVKGFGKSSLN